MRSNPFPMAKSRPTTPEEDARSRAAFEEVDARHRLYVSKEEIAELVRRGVVCDFGVGNGLMWLIPTPLDRSAFVLLIELRTDAALPVAGA